MSKIIGQFNERISEQWSLVQMVSGNFLALHIPQNSYGAHITGVGFGMHLQPAVDVPEAGVWCLGLNGFVPEVTDNIYTRLGIASNFLPVSSVIPRGFYFHFAHSTPLDRDDDFAEPILVPGGESFCLIVATLTRSLSAAATAGVYLTVRGRLLKEQESKLLR